MTEVRKVTGPTSRFDRNASPIVALVVAAILLAILKPWGTGDGPTAIATPGTRPTGSGSSPPEVGTRLYDFLTFGTNEPPPSWELWPAGNLASFYFAMRIDLTARPPEDPSAIPSGSPAASATPIPIGSPIEDPEPGAVPSSWPTIRISAGSHLDLLGLNRPLGYGIGSITLVRLNDDGTEERVHAIIGTSPWPDHFTIVGYAAAGAADRTSMEPWPPGTYRLDAVIEPGHLSRTVDIVIETERPGAPSMTPAGSASPAP
jgi:hypothetical protein